MKPIDEKLVKSFLEAPIETSFDGMIDSMFNGEEIPHEIRERFKMMFFGGAYVMMQLTRSTTPDNLTHAAVVECGGYALDQGSDPRYNPFAKIQTIHIDLSATPDKSQAN